MSSRINFRVYPFTNCPSFQVLCNLKRDCFVDSDLEHLMYGYGNRPNVPLAVFGLVTSLPPEDDPAFDPLAEFETDEALPERVAFEKAFRKMFGAIGRARKLRPILTISERNRSSHRRISVFRRG